MSEPVSPQAAAHDDARAYVGLGGNLGDRIATLRSAARALGMLEGTHVVAASPVYETRPIGPSIEPFLNAAVELRTTLAPEPLLDALLAIEVQHGRERRRRWDARTLDLDLLVYLRPHAGGWLAAHVEQDVLTLPHPRIGERDFVLVPLRDLAGDALPLHGRPLEAWLCGLEDGDRTILRQVVDAGGLLR